MIFSKNISEIVLACRLHLQCTTEDTMNENGVHKTQKTFWDIPSAAGQVGYSSRHFRRIIEEDGIPIMQIGRKFFIIGRDFETWKLTRGVARLQEAAQPS